tara:strand:+ start:465 stop:833 length:369 start_codon:yes stop_codon:yes gene_type:complete
MSLYRFARTSALLAVARKYRLKIFYMLTAIAVALVTDWLYVDVAGYLAERSPTWALVALVVKTVVVFSALFFFLWQVKPSEWQRPHKPEAPSEGDGMASTSKLGKIAEKETLKTRKDAILGK